MRKLPKRKGVSLGTIIMLSFTFFAIACSGWLFSKFHGQTDFQFNAENLAVAFDDPNNDLFEGASSAASSESASLSSPLQVQPKLQPAITPAPTKLSFHFTAAGSVFIDSTTQKAMTSDAGYQFTDLFQPLRDELEADLSLFTLLNTVVSTEKLSSPNIPDNALTALQAAGFQAVFLGSSGALNYGISGLSATQNAIQSANMTPYGLYTSAQQQENPPLMTVNGLSVALLGFQSELSAADKRKTSKEEQAFAISLPTLPVITESIDRAKKAGAQVVIISINWGKKGASSPSKTQRELAQGIANAGADLILGSYSNAVQEAEILTAIRPDGSTSQTLCVYSLGNLFSNEREKRANISGALFHANISYDLISKTTSFDQLSYTPTYVWRGKKTDATTYAVIPSDEAAPDFVQGEQLTIMQRSFALIEDVMNNTPFSLRDPKKLFEVQ